ncbi:MAG: hydroxymethylbilane synthase, partial [Kiritimatiellia bacterium]
MSALPSPLRVFSRSSRLARLQVEEALPFLQQAFPGREFQAEALETVGDRDLSTPLTDPSVPADFFSRELDRLQLMGEADLVVHSAKDLPQPLPEGLVLGAMLPARDTRDSLVIREGVDLREGGVIGTSSSVREAAMRELYPLCTFKSIRGDIGQRLAQLDAGDYDAVIIAGCALLRLQLDHRISEWLDYET